MTSGFVEGDALNFLLPAFFGFATMARLQLVRRYAIWLPTLRGWLVLLALFVVGVLAAKQMAYSLLAPNAPAAGARILVVEGWIGTEEIEQAITLIRQGGYDEVVTSGGPIERWPELIGASNYADLAFNYLRQRNLGGVRLSSAPAPASAQDRTFLSAVKVRDWMHKQQPGAQAIDVFTSGVHARRTQMMYRQAFGSGVTVGIHSASPKDFGEANWWKSSVGAKAVSGELISIAWTVCCFRPGPRDSHEEHWGIPRAPGPDG